MNPETPKFNEGDEKVSSLHDDFEVPFQDKNKPEYDVEKGYPNRYENTGERGEKSVIQRIKQFGITEDDIAKSGITNLAEISESDYSALVKEAVKKQYETLFASVFGHWSEIPNSQEQLDLIKRVSRFYKDWGFNLVNSHSEKKGSPNMVIALEGADFIESLGDVDKLHETGVGSVILQYGKENRLADQNGLTPLGRQCVKKMLDLGIIVDLAHATPQTRKGIIDIIENENKGKQLAYTHGATVEDIAQDYQFASAAEKRGLSDEEVKRIIKLGGIIGLGISRPFFPSIEKIVERIDKLCQIDNGPILLGLGTDFGGVPPTWDIGIGSPEDIVKIADSLSDKYGYSDSLIQNILRKNISNWVKKEK